MQINKPLNGTYPAYYETYISKVTGNNLIEMMLNEHYETIDLITSIDLETQHFRYAEGKWNCKEIIQHVMDTERVMAYRAMCIARGEQVNLPGFDENKYAIYAMATKRNMDDIAREFSVLRASTIELIKSLSPEMLDITGTANNNPLTVRALLYIIAGHEIHHRKVIEERYLPK